MIEFKQQGVQYKPECGDLLPFDDDKYLFEISNYDKSRNLNNIFYLGRGTPWSILTDLRIDVSPIRQKYVCPHSGMEFFSLVPIYIMSDNIQKYREQPFSDMVLDREWNWDQDFDIEKNEPYYDGRIFKSMIGTGYTGFTNASDGSNEYKILAAELENGDIVLCLTWIWYNK